MGRHTGQHVLVPHSCVVTLPDSVAPGPSAQLPLQHACPAAQLPPVGVVQGQMPLALSTTDWVPCSEAGAWARFGGEGLVGGPAHAQRPCMPGTCVHA